MEHGGLFMVNPFYFDGISWNFMNDFMRFDGIKKTIMFAMSVSEGGVYPPKWIQFIIKEWGEL